VRLVQGRGVDHRLGLAHPAVDEAAIGDRADGRRVGRLEHVEANDVVAVGAEDADERLAEMPGAARDEDAQR
jgi:hypothetical protein